MALTYGFYNSIEGDRVYNAIQFGRIFDGIIKDGVYATYEKGMMVIASSNPAEVIIQPGRAWFNHTWSYNDANVIFEAPAPEVLLERYDALVLEINEELSSRENSFKWVQGTPSSRPERPTLTNTSTIHQYPLCYVHRYPETTMIYTRDITNMIGTSECPFATGVLEGIDLDAWINQWDDEFHNWEDSKKTQFEAWMLSQETAFTTWYNAFKNQMAADVQEVEDFVDYLKSVLDASTAIHLQEEIDELKNEISSGSHITVTTINPELYGRNVTITEAGGTVFTEKFDNTGVAVFKSVPFVGDLTISSTYGTQTAERVVNTPYYARYEFAIAFWAATVNIVGDPEMAGSSVTVKDSDGTIVGTVALDSEGTGVYTAIKPDTYKFSITYGGETMEVTLSVTQETTYTVDLHAAGFNWQDWLEAGGVTGSYSSLDDVLEDEVALRRLFTVHASVDYMAGIDKENEEVETIIGNDLCTKWINNRDYALDTLHANEVIAGYMDTADKYGYGEWVITDDTTTPPTWGPKGNVPVMTANDAPYGTASASSEFNANNAAWKAFNGVLTDWWSCTQDQINPNITYKFTNPTAVKRVRHWQNENGGCSCKIRYSDDGITFTDVPDSQYTTIVNGWVTKDISNVGYHLYWNVYFNNLTNHFSSSNIQFYGREASGLVPAMQGNTCVEGTVIKDSEYSGSEAYHVFDMLSTSSWCPSNQVCPGWVGFKFNDKKVVNAITITPNFWSNNLRAKNLIIQATDDENDSWTNIKSYTLPNAKGTYTIAFDNTTAYYCWRVYVSDSYAVGDTGPVCQLTSLQFLGVGDYSEKEFEVGTTKKWLYDHGVELETITPIYPANAKKTIEGLDFNVVSNPGANVCSGFVTDSFDLTNYTVARAKLGNKMIFDTGGGRCGQIMVATNLSEATKAWGNYTLLGCFNMTPSYVPYNSGFGISSINQSAQLFIGDQNGQGGPIRFIATELWLE